MTHTTSVPERTRRNKVLHAMMDEHGYDALLVAGRGDEFMRGRVQYVSDVFQWAGWGFVLLPRSGQGVLLCDPLGGYEASDELWLSDVRVSATPSADLAAMLHDLGAARGRIGVAGLADIVNAAHVEELRAALPEATLVDATDAFDDVRAIKSDEEIANLAQTSAILRTSSRRSRPRSARRTERDVLAEAHRLCRQLGCVEGIAMMGRAPAAGLRPRQRPTRSCAADIIVVDLEWGGPTGYWLELRRCFSFGPPPDAVRRLLGGARRDVRGVRRRDARRGVLARTSSPRATRTHARHGLTRRRSDVRYSAHGIGIDSLEPPWVPGKERELRAGMMLSLHPNAVARRRSRSAVGAVSVGDNVLVTAGGPAE